MESESQDAGGGRVRAEPRLERIEQGPENRRKHHERRAGHIEELLMPVQIEKAKDLTCQGVFVGRKEPTARQKDQHIPQREGQQDGEINHGCGRGVALHTAEQRTHPVQKACLPRWRRVWRPRRDAPGGRWSRALRHEVLWRRRLATEMSSSLASHKVLFCDSIASPVWGRSPACPIPPAPRG